MIHIHTSLMALKPLVRRHFFQKLSTTYIVIYVASSNLNPSAPAPTIAAIFAAFKVAVSAADTRAAKMQCYLSLRCLSAWSCSSPHLLVVAC